MTTHVKVSGTWKEVNGVYTRVSGTWKEVAEGHVKVGGTWKQFYSNGPPTSFGADLTSTTYASAGSVNSSPYTADKAFDNNTGTNWLTSPSVAEADCWIQQDFGASNEKAIRKLTLRNSTHGGLSASYWSEGWKLQYSDNGSSWTDALEWYSGAAALTKTDNSTTTDVYVFQNHGAHRYWRVRCIVATGMEGGWYTGLGEIEMMEAA